MGKVLILWRTAQMASDLKFPGVAAFYKLAVAGAVVQISARREERRVERAAIEVVPAGGGRAIARGHDQPRGSQHGQSCVDRGAAEIDASVPRWRDAVQPGGAGRPRHRRDHLQDEIAPEIVTKAHRITLYASSKDLCVCVAAIQQRRPSGRRGRRSGCRARH